MLLLETLAFHTGLQLYTHTHTVEFRGDFREKDFRPHIIFLNLTTKPQSPDFFPCKRSESN